MAIKKKGEIVRKMENLKENKGIQKEQKKGNRKERGCIKINR